MTATSENPEFFPDYYEKVKKLINPNDINALGNFKTDLERIQHVSKISIVSENKVKINREFAGKSEENALKLKQIGNEAFRNKKWTEALMLYSKSYVSMPGEKGEKVKVERKPKRKSVLTSIVPSTRKIARCAIYIAAASKKS